MTLRTLIRVWVKRKSVERRRQSLPKARETSWPTLFVTSRQMSATALIMLSLTTEGCISEQMVCVPSKDLTVTVKKDPSVQSLISDCS